jgi:hypothetical protein
MLDIHTAVLLGQLSNLRNDNPMNWELPLAAKLTLALIHTISALIRGKQIHQNRFFSNVEQHHT